MQFSRSESTDGRGLLLRCNREKVATDKCEMHHPAQEQSFWKSARQSGTAAKGAGVARKILASEGNIQPSQAYGPRLLLLLRKICSDPSILQSTEDTVVLRSQLASIHSAETHATCSDATTQPTIISSKAPRLRRRREKLILTVSPGHSKSSPHPQLTLTKLSEPNHKLP